MEKSDKKAFALLIAGVYAYHRQACSEALIEMYWRGCQRWTIEEVTKAVDQLTHDPEAGKFPPKIGDLTRVLEGTSTDRAAVAWGVVMQAIGAVGAYRDVDFGDPATHAAIHDLGGWPKVCRTDLAELGYLQHRFAVSYRAYAARGVEECPLVLTGDRSPDAEYERKGLPAPRARLFGPKPCREVLAGMPRLATVVTQRLGMQQGGSHAA